MPDDAQQLATLSDADLAALTPWLRPGVDGSQMVLRRPPLHPRPTSGKTMLREIAVLLIDLGARVAKGTTRSLTDETLRCATRRRWGSFASRREVSRRRERA